MLIIPAIDIKDSRCVRLVQGRMEEETVYSENPAAVALMWQKKGARLIHVVDLDAAVSGKPINYNKIAEIASSVRIPVQIGGGIRNLTSAQAYLALDNVERIVVGTSAYENQGFLKDLVKKYPARIAAGIDAKNGYVAIKGWLEVTDTDAFELAATLKNLGVSFIIYTDISRDGMMAGPNVEAVRKLVTAVDIPVIASGGISDLKDISSLKKTGVWGVIIGKALYSGAIDLKEAIEEFQE